MLKRIGTLLLAVLLLTGCWSRRELNDIGLVVALGIDRAESGALAVTMGIAEPGAAKAGNLNRAGEERRRMLIQREGATISEAIRTAEQTVPRRLILHHCRIVLLGERLAEEGMSEVMDYLLRSPEMRLSAHIFIARREPPAALLELDPFMDPLPSLALTELAELGTGLTVTLRDFFIAQASGFQAPIIPTLVTHPHPLHEPKAPPKEITLSGAAVLKHGRVAAYLDHSQVRGAMWLRHVVRGTLVTLDCPDRPKKPISMRLSNENVDVSGWWDGEKINYKVLARADIFLTDMHCPLDLHDVNALEQIRMDVADQIEERIDEVVEITQSLEVDPFAFGEYARAFFPGVFREVGGPKWGEYWATLPVHVEAAMGNIHVNMTTEPPTARVR